MFLTNNYNKNNTNFMLMFAMLTLLPGDQPVVYLLNCSELLFSGYCGSLYKSSCAVFGLHAHAISAEEAAASLWIR